MVLFLSYYMKLKFIVIIALCSCATSKTHNTDTSSAKATVVKTPRLPVELIFEQVPENLRPLFRAQVVARGIDTIGTREGIRLMLTEIQKVSKGQDAAAAAKSLPVKYNMLHFGAVGDAKSISRISWRAYPFRGAGRDDTTHYYCNTPDSLLSQPARTIAACLEEVLKSRKLQ